MDYANKLLEAINNYSDSDTESKNNLRDWVCIISESEELKNDKFIKELLYIAANKMRTFGYNSQNGFTNEPYENVTDLMHVRDGAVKRYYKSNVLDNNSLDKTQKEVVDLFSSLEVKRLLVSAPTSYGKTYLMREILYINKERYNNVLLVFPTVALLKENTREMNDFVNKKELEYKVINTVRTPVESGEKYIFVFTPERALQLMALFPDLEIDFFFFDEIYKIDEDYCNDETDEKEVDSKKKSILDEARAKAFRIVLYLLSKKVKEYYLAGPNLNKDSFGKGMMRYIASNNISIKEITFEPTLRINIEAWGGKIKENYPLLPSSTVALTVTKKDEKINNIVSYIGTKKYGQTMLYCTSPAKASEYAKKLAASYPQKLNKSHRLNIFIAHINDKYNIQNSALEWSLVKVLDNGFAIHHGKLPRYIQNEILNMFNAGIFDIMFCTSTIVEGVNTKAKNMVLLNTSKGRELLTPFDIKNIKGRAGRYYHNFIGRVFYTDKLQKQIEDDFKMTLDFATYRDDAISNVDLDNAEIIDLSGNNVALKSDRVYVQKSYLITDDVFIKNRLIPKDIQEKLLQILFCNEKMIEPFISLIENKFEIKRLFLSGYLLNSVLNLFVEANILDEITAKVYNGIGYSYYKKGFNGILEHEIKKARKNNTSIDKAYANAFANLKNIIEHKIPKILSLFEAVFIFACSERGYDMQGFSLSSVNRFYETGVSTDFGEFLVEYGFPTDTVRLIETRLNKYLDKPLGEVVSICKNDMKQFLALLDSYERILFVEAIDSYR